MTRSSHTPGTGPPAGNGLLVRAGMVLPIAGPPIPDGALRVRAGEITAVGPAAALPPEPGETVLDLPDCILLPGLVNAHCHLELGGLAGRVPYPGSFPQWVLSLISHERPDAMGVERAVAAGVRALLAGGATCVGDITTTGLTREPLQRAGIRAVSCRELLGLSPDRVGPALAEARAWLRRGEEGMGSVGSEAIPDFPHFPYCPHSRHSHLEGAPDCSRVRPGLSPHAPYSTAATTYREAARLAQASSAPFATHLSESMDEIEFVARGEGGFAALLRARGIPLDSWDPPGCSPVRCLADLGVLDVLGAAAHVNYLLPGDLELLAAGRLVPVYCPGSHRFFGHPPHPAGEMLRAGIPVALGTDSLASNDRLHMLAEARAAWQAVPGTSAADWIRAATANGARALGLGEACGTLEPGKRADLVAIHPGARARDPHEAALSPGSQVRLATVDGEMLHEQR